ncbi:MAG: iron-sulfur cluster-binding protein [Thermoplasmata archaeon HGW-Thermoplasmata-1]|nr:MAG: iron-sulfur cluster-binding protein [Thermoplasmata archaeon HGW-Thermoplasmata-1]
MKVSIEECQSYEADSVRSAIDSCLRAIGFEVPSRKKVLIKPNVLSQHSPNEAITTHPEIVGALIDIFIEKGCEVFVGDSSATCRRGGTCRALDVSGIAAIAKGKGAKTLNLESVPVRMVRDGSALIYKELEISGAVFDADLVVNACKMKTHTLMRYTGGVKNLLGTIPGGRKQQLHALAPSPRDFANVLVDIYKNVMPSLTVMDAVVGLEGNGPGKAGRPKKTGLILASKSAPALDFVASNIMGFDPMDVPTNRACVERGLVDPDEIEIIGKFRVVRYRKPVGVPAMSKRLVGWGIKIQSRLPSVIEDKCVKCGLCAGVCPANAITMSPYPVIDAKKCISCYCCHESCPKAAIRLKMRGPFSK